MKHLSKYIQLLCSFLCLLALATTIYGAESVAVVPNEVLALVDSQAEAEAVADAYGIELLSYGYGVAVFTQPAMVASVNAITIDDTADDTADNLPTLYENILVSYEEEDELGLSEPLSLSEAALEYVGHHLDTIDFDLMTKNVDDYPTGKGVTVAVIDTGVDTDHPDLLVAVDETLAYNAHTQVQTLTAVEDQHGHGTHVAGTIAAAANNVNNVVGIAPDVNIMVVKASRDYDDLFEMAALLRAVNYAVANGADVINMSLGGYSVYTPFQTVIETAYNAGVITVCAAGNESTNEHSYPAAYDYTIGVSATSEVEVFDSRYSNYGSYIDIAAPGTYIVSTYLDGDYKVSSGTSMATPVVTAVVALLIEQNPTYTPADIEALLTGSAKDSGDFGRDDYYGNGIANIYAALVDTKWTVTYQNDTTELGTHSVADGATLFAPTDPTGLVEFAGWSTDEDGEDFFNFDTTIAESMTLYAQWLKLSQDAPAAPTVSVAYEGGSLTLATIAGAEYGVNTSNIAPETWQDSTTFTSLSDHTTYYFFARMAETDTYEASESSPALVVFTTEPPTFGGSVTISNPIYGNNWEDVISYVKNNDDPTGTYTIAINGVAITDESKVDDVATYTYEVLYSGTYDTITYTNIQAKTGTVPTQPLTAEITWDSDSLALEYNWYNQLPTATVTNLVNEDDDVTPVVEFDGVEGTDYSIPGTYTAKITGFTGEDDYRYAVPTENATTSYTIAAADGFIYPDATIVEAVYGDELELVLWVVPLSFMSDTESGSVSATPDTVTFYVDDTVLYTATDVDATLTGDEVVWIYDTTDRVLPIGTTYVSVAYSGGDYLEAVTEENLFAVILSQKEITSSMVSTISSQTYTGSAIKPTVTVSGLTLGTDYTVTYSNNVSTGTATATITGIGYYTGTVNKTFTIAAATTTTTTTTTVVSGGSSTSSSSSSTESDDTTEETEENVVTITAEDTTATVTSAELSTAVESGQTTEVVTEVATLTIPADTLEEIVSQANGADITLQVAVVEDDSITALLGEALVIDVTLLADGKPITDFNGSSITIQIPYALTADQDAGGIVVWYVDDDGNATLVDAWYDADTESVMAELYHFSYYAVTYAGLLETCGGFTDVFTSDYYSDAVLWAVEQGITTGKSATVFAPNDVNTRAEAVTFLWRAMGSPEASIDNPFTDLDEDAYYYEAVLWAIENGITAGISDTTFSPDMDCTRAHIVTFLWRMVGELNADTDNMFDDVGDDDYYRGAVLWAVTEEITNGMGDNTFAPSNGCTRAQIVTLLYRYFG